MDETEEDTPSGKQVGTPRDERLREVEQWAAGGIELKARAAQTARRVLFDELRAGIRWEEIGFGQEAVRRFGLRGSAQVQMNLAVRIANTAGGGAAGAADPLIVIEPNGQMLACCRVFSCANDTVRGTFPGGLDALSRIRIIVREAENDLVRRLEADQFSRKFLTDAGQVLFLAAAALGVGTGSQRGHPLAAALTVARRASGRFGTLESLERLCARGPDDIRTCTGSDSSGIRSSARFPSGHHGDRHDSFRHETIEERSRRTAEGAGQ